MTLCFTGYHNLVTLKKKQFTSKWIEFSTGNQKVETWLHDTASSAKGLPNKLN